MRDVKEVLEKNYSIIAKEVIRIEYGLWEENYRVNTESKSYFIKKFIKKDRLEKKYDLMVRGVELGQSLRTKAIPVPLHIYDNNNDMFSRYQNNTYQVNEWIDGITYRPGQAPKEACYSMGKLLGKIHKMINTEYTLEETESINLKEAIKNKKLLLNEFKLKDKESYVIIKSLEKQIELLNKLLENAYRNDSFLSKKGKVYNSYWIEQLLFGKEH